MSLSRDHMRDGLEADAKLKYVTPIIEHLYFKENAPDWLVTNILDEHFGFKISNANLRKRFVKNKVNDSDVKKRTRTIDREARKQQVILQLKRSNILTHYWPLLQSQPRLRRYDLQERAIYSIKQFLNPMFDQGGSATWTASATGFIRPDGTELSPDKWQAIEAYCDSVSTMLRCNQIKASQQILLSLKSDLVDVFLEMDPLFLGQIWKLSLVLHGFDRRAPQLQAVSTVLGSMRLYAQIRHGRESPAVVILNCVLGVEDADFRTTMQLGFRESLKVLDNKVIRENMVILKLWYTYAQYFCKPYVKATKRKPLFSTPSPPPKTYKKAARQCASVSEPYERLTEHVRGDIMLLKFNQVWQQCYSPEILPPSQWRESSLYLRISHHYAYAAFWVCGKPDLAENLARNILEATQFNLQPHPTWNSDTMAFTIARKIIATRQHRRGELSACERTLMETISFLRTGDNTCRIRAVGICLTLSSWKLKWGDRGPSSDADALLYQIQREIGGLDMCESCKPSLKCEDCFRKRSYCSGHTIRRKVCRTCKNAEQRRRNTIKAQQELADFSVAGTSSIM